MFQPYIDNLVSVFASIINYIEAKIAMGALITVYSFFFSIDSWQLMLALTALIIFDLITGVFAAYKAGNAIESRKVCKTAVKLGVYAILVSSAHLTDFVVGIPDGWLNLELAMISFLAATELVSIIENVGKMGYAVPKKILNQLENFRQDK